MSPTKIDVKVTKLTSPELVQAACSFTTGRSSRASLSKMYDCEHSPIRTQLFWIELKNIPTFVSVHFTRHKVGVEHFVKTNRVDRGGDENVSRTTPVNHAMLINAQALINLARKRLCNHASFETREVMRAIKKALLVADPDLYKYLVPECEYRRACHELRCCGHIHTVRFQGV